jgi:hypothetical protein
LTQLGIPPSLEALMPRFHFVIVDGVRVPDPVGTVCTEKQARQLASDIANQIVTDMGFDKARTVIVTDDAGSEIHKVLPEDLESRNVREQRTGGGNIRPTNDEHNLEIGFRFDVHDRFRHRGER